MIARAWPLLLLFGTCCPSGCGSVEPPFVGELALFDDGRTLIVEGRDGTVSAVAPQTGQPRWHFKPLPEPFPSFVSLPTRHLVCPLRRTTAGALLLRYHGRLLALDSRTGKRLWERALPGWATDERRCPTPTADGGVLLLRAHGLFLQKLDSSGRDGWRVALGRLGPALAPAHVSMPSGDALVRTRSYVANINPEGKLNWVQRR